MSIYNKDIGQFIRVAEKAKELNDKKIVNAINKYIYIYITIKNILIIKYVNFMFCFH